VASIDEAEEAILYAAVARLDADEAQKNDPTSRHHGVHLRSETVKPQPASLPRMEEG
jgi:hypothetical protein